MAFNGELQHLPIVDIIQLLHATKKSGTLAVTGEKGECRLVFSEGLIVGANYLNGTIRIGRVLIRIQAVSPEDLKTALKAQEEAARKRRQADEARQEAAANRPPPPPPRPAEKQPPRIPFQYIGYLGPKNDRIAVFQEGEDLLLAKRGEPLQDLFTVVDIRYESVVMGFTDPEFESRTRELPMKGK